jgi:hypothetical protein
MPPAAAMPGSIRRGPSRELAVEKLSFDLQSDQQEE